jgi:hypothetical protein
VTNAHSARIVDTVCDDEVLIRLYNHYVHIVHECVVYATHLDGDDNTLSAILKLVVNVLLNKVRDNIV